MAPLPRNPWSTQPWAANSLLRAKNNRGLIFTFSIPWGAYIWPCHTPQGTSHTAASPEGPYGPIFKNQGPTGALSHLFNTPPQPA